MLGALRDPMFLPRRLEHIDCGTEIESQDSKAHDQIGPGRHDSGRQRAGNNDGDIRHRVVPSRQERGSR